MMTKEKQPYRTLPCQSVSIEMPEWAKDLPPKAQSIIAEEILHRMIMSRDPRLKYE